jgi:hypothetical protein
MPANVTALIYRKTRGMPGSTANLEIVRERYHAMPENRRIYVLGDMDRTTSRCASC